MRGGELSNVRSERDCGVPYLPGEVCVLPHRYQRPVGPAVYLGEHTGTERELTVNKGWLGAFEDLRWL